MAIYALTDRVVPACNLKWTVRTSYAGKKPRAFLQAHACRNNRGSKGWTRSGNWPDLSRVKSALSAFHGPLRTALGFDAAYRLHGQAQTALVVGLDDLDADHLTDLQDIVDVGDAVVGDFGNVQQAVASRQNLDDGAEVQQAQYRAFIFLADLDISGQFLDTALGFAGLVQIRAGNGDGAV